MGDLDSFIRLHQLKLENGELKLMGWNATIISAMFFADLYRRLKIVNSENVLYDSAKKTS